MQTIFLWHPRTVYLERHWALWYATFYWYLSKGIVWLYAVFHVPVNNNGNSWNKTRYVSTRLQIRCMKINKSTKKAFRKEQKTTHFYSALKNENSVINYSPSCCSKPVRYKNIFCAQKKPKITTLFNNIFSPCQSSTHVCISTTVEERWDKYHQPSQSTCTTTEQQR